jgi:uncharacterized oligopeptide transporter (OPT) family protein
MGYDLKAGYMLRGNGADPVFEREGRKQQLFAALFAFAVAGVVVLIAYPNYLANNLVAPVDRVYAATIKAGASADVAWHGSCCYGPFPVPSCNLLADRNVSSAYCSRPDFCCWCPMPDGR